MNYTNSFLIIIGLFGILCHNLLKMDEINKKEAGNFKLWPFLKLERFSIMLSICAVIVAVMAKTEVRKLEAAGKWLGLGLFAVGFMAQSIIYKFRGKAEKMIEDK